MTPSEIEPATFRLVAQCLNQLRHSVPPNQPIQGCTLLNDTAYHNHHKHTQPREVSKRIFFQFFIRYSNQISRLYLGVTRKATRFHHTLVLFLHPHAPSIWLHNQSDSSFSSPVYPQMSQETIPFFCYWNFQAIYLNFLKSLSSVSSANSFPCAGSVPHSRSHKISL